MSDEVDEIVAAWARERPDVDTSSMHIWSRLSRLAIDLDAARRRAFADHSLEPYEFDVLAALRRSGTPYRLSPGQLMKATHVTSGTMTNRIDRLVARGFVERVAHPEDRRVTLVGLLDDGRDAVDAALVDLLAVENSLLEGTDAATRRSLTDGLRALLGRRPE